MYTISNYLGLVDMFHVLNLLKILFQGANEINWSD
jgi:hypothetical protein